MELTHARAAGWSGADAREGGDIFALSLHAPRLRLESCDSRLEMAGRKFHGVGTYWLAGGIRAPGL